MKALLLYTVIFLISAMNVFSFGIHSTITTDSVYSSPEDSSLTLSPMKGKKMVIKIPRQWLLKDTATKRSFTVSKKGTKIRFSGYGRAFFQYRLMDSYYAGIAPKSISFNGVDVKDNIIYQTGINNIGYPEPLIYLRAEASPTQNTSFIVDYFFDNQLLGSNTTGRVITNYRSLQFIANTKTDIGSFKLIAGGGVNWYRLSPFTLWNYEYRDDLFERYPWEPEGSSFQKYSNYYQTQNISRDARWGNTGTQGFILEASGLPAGFGANLLYGKTDNSGAFSGFLTNAPRNMITGRVDKMFGKMGRHKVGVNYFDQFGYIDNLGEEGVTQTIVTGDLRLNLKGVKVFSEIGMGGYQDKLYNFGWGEAINIQGEFDKTLFKIPAMLQFYYVDKSVINVNSLVLNTSHPNLQEIYGSTDQYTITTYKGAVPEFGQLTNNRTGLYLKVFDSFKKDLKFIIGTGISKDIENLDNGVTLYHRVNAFPRSRFTYFQNSLGPYNRIMSIFRRTFEHFTITDTSNFNKAYNVLDVTLKYKFRLFNRELIISNYVNYNSVQDGLSGIPKFSKDAYFRQVYDEIMAFYKVMPKVSLVGFWGIEKVKGNSLTELAPNGLPSDQTGVGYGIGLDYDYGGRGGFYLRHRWFSHEDKNFVLDAFKGQETSLEVKVFF